MAKADKVLSAIPLAKMIKRADNVKFELLSQNGFFAVISGQSVMEFDTAQEAKKVIDALNASIQTVLNEFRSDYETKIGSILA